VCRERDTAHLKSPGWPRFVECDLDPSHTHTHVRLVVGGLIPSVEKSANQKF
jgi:hypothetical protein